MFKYKIIRQLVVLAFMLGLNNSLFATPVFAADPCAPRDKLLSKPTIHTVADCLDYIASDSIDPFAKKILKRLLPANQSEYNSFHTLAEKWGSDDNTSYLYSDFNYVQVAEVIDLMNLSTDSKPLLKRYMDFIIVSQHSADEGRSYGLGKLYISHAPKFLEILSSYTEKEQRIVIARLGWGLPHNFPNLTKENYRRLIIGSHQEILDKNYPHRNLTSQIEKEVLSVLNWIESRK